VTDKYKLIRAILIDPHTETVSLIEEPFNNGHVPLGRALCCPEHHEQLGDTANHIRPLSAGPQFDAGFHNILTSYVDDEGLFRKNQKFFRIGDCPDPIGGRMIVLMQTLSGVASIPSYVRPQDFSSSILWLTREEAAPMVRPTTISTLDADMQATVQQSFPIDILNEEEWTN
jgi:hypothetical protein